MQQYPAVKGLAKPLFFWTHRELEGGQGSTEGRSKFNTYEVDAAVALARCVFGSDQSCSCAVQTHTAPVRAGVGRLLQGSMSCMDWLDMLTALLAD